jgi:dienelactone hydrolase
MMAQGLMIFREAGLASRMHWIGLALGLALVAATSTAGAQEKVTFPSLDADQTGGKPTTVSGYLYKPEGPGPFPAVVGLHGCDGLVDQQGKIEALYGTWGEILSKEGYVVLWADSFSPRGYGNLCAVQPISARPVLPYRETPRDAFGAMEYLRSRSDVRPESIAILGQSYGGLAMLFTVADDALPNSVPPNKDFRAAIAFYPNCPPLVAAKPNWKPRQRMLFLMGEADNFTPPAPCKDMLAREKAAGGPAIDVHFYPDTFHAFDHPNLPKTVRTNVKLPPDGHSPIVGTNPEARADAIDRVKKFLAEELK